jgi:probable rRNA maturation factor
MLSALHERGAELSVMLTDDVSIHVLNAKHRRKNKPTDVLAFPMDTEGVSPKGAVRLLGDVVISLDTAGRQAKAHRHPLLTEVTLLLAHGLLHLVGYDHRTDKEERVMNAEAARLVALSTRASLGQRTLSRRLRDRPLTSRAR